MGKYDEDVREKLGTEVVKTILDAVRSAEITKQNMGDIAMHRVLDLKSVEAISNVAKVLMLLKCVEFFLIGMKMISVIRIQNKEFKS